MTGTVLNTYQRSKEDNADDLILDNQLNKGKLKMLVPLDSRNSKVDLLRIACTFDNFRIIAPAFKILKQKGYKTAVNIMQISKIRKEQLRELAKIATENDIDIRHNEVDTDWEWLRERSFIIQKNCRTEEYP